MDIIRQIEDSGLTQTKAVTEALLYYLSEDYKQIKYYQKQISEDARKIAILEAHVAGLESFKALIEEQTELSRAHISQVQSLLQQMESERRSKEDIIRQKEEKILLLEDGKKKKWWKLW
jgi:phage-related minor tail protein